MAPEPADTQYQQQPTSREDAVPQGHPAANGGGAGGGQPPDPGFTNTQRVDSIDSNDGRQLPAGDAGGAGGKRAHLQDKVGVRSDPSVHCSCGAGSCALTPCHVLQHACIAAILLPEHDGRGSA